MSAAGRRERAPKGPAGRSTTYRHVAAVANKDLVGREPGQGAGEKDVKVRFQQASVPLQMGAHRGVGPHHVVVDKTVPAVAAAHVRARRCVFLTPAEHGSMATWRRTTARASRGVSCRSRPGQMCTRHVGYPGQTGAAGIAGLGRGDDTGSKRKETKRRQTCVFCFVLLFFLFRAPLHKGENHRMDPDHPQQPASPADGQTDAQMDKHRGGRTNTDKDARCPRRTFPTGCRARSWALRR